MRGIRVTLPVDETRREKYRARMDAMVAALMTMPEKPKCMAGIDAIVSAGNLLAKIDAAVEEKFPPSKPAAGK